MMRISITLTSDQERKLEQLAHESGKDPSNYVNDMITAHLDKVGARGQKTFEGSSPLSGKDGAKVA